MSRLRRSLALCASSCELVALLALAGCERDENRAAVTQGKQWFASYNCAGCHGPGGGGGMGPALNDSEWIYGSDPEHILATVVEGRPNGMPSYRGKIDDERLWQLVAFVRSLSGLTPTEPEPSVP